MKYYLADMLCRRCCKNFESVGAGVNINSQNHPCPHCGGNYSLAFRYKTISKQNFEIMTGKKIKKRKKRK